MNKKILFVIGGLQVVIVVGFFIVNPFKKTAKAPQSSIPQASSENVLTNSLAISDRPYITLVPKSAIEPQSLGHWVTVTWEDAKNFDRCEYEFEYTNGLMIQGGMGKLDFIEEKPPVSKEIAFGSASKGKYKYDEGVNKGSFTFHYFSGNAESVLKTDFNLTKKETSDQVITSPDEKATLVSSQTDINLGDFVISFSTLGLPMPQDGEIISGPYGFYNDSNKTFKNSQLTFNDISESNVTIFAWDGKSWQSLDTQVSQNQASADIGKLGTFILVKK